MKPTAGNPRLARTFALAALIAGLLAAWLASNYAGGVERRAGRPVNVLVAARPIARGQPVAADMAGSAIVVRSVPRSYAPPDAIRSLDRLIGARAVAAVGAGAYLTAPLFVSGARSGAGFRLRGGERAVTIDAKAAPEGAVIQPGAVVDVFASGLAGGSATTLLLAGAEVLAADRSGDAGAVWQITLRVRSEQAAGLIKGDVFAKELRAIVLP